VLQIENCGTVRASATTVWSSGVLEIGANPNLYGALTFNGGTLRAIANTTFSHDASLASGVVALGSPGSSCKMHRCQYTAQLRGKNDSSGIGVVQVYFIQ
jgi:hypothetical protein